MPERDLPPGFLARLLARLVASGERLILGSNGSRSRGEFPAALARLLRKFGHRVAGEATRGSPPMAAFTRLDREGKTAYNLRP